jgi:hypothetical protein
MNALKENNLKREVGHLCEMPQTWSAIWEQIPAELTWDLTGRQLGMVAKAINAAYQKGKAEANKDCDAMGCVWIACADGGKGMLLPKEALKHLQKNDTTEILETPIERDYHALMSTDVRREGQEFSTYDVKAGDVKLSRIGRTGYILDYTERY